MAAEFALAGAGAAVLGLTGHGRWMAWWVALVVAAHFVSLAWIFHGPPLAVLGVVQVVALAVVAVLVMSETHPTSRWVGPLMGLTILVYARRLSPTPALSAHSRRCMVLRMGRHRLNETF